jgi:hypothetical protein
MSGLRARSASPRAPVANVGALTVGDGFDDGSLRQRRGAGVGNRWATLNRWR